MTSPRRLLIRILAVTVTTLVATTSALAGAAGAAGTADAAGSSARQVRFGRIGDDNSFPAALATSILQPTRSPLGANDWACRPSTLHPEPVVLVHGTLENAYDNWNGLSPIIKDQGYCVFALNYGNTTGIGFLNGTGDLIANAQEIGPFVDRVLAATGAQKVDLIGHSQGGALIRYYTDVLGGSSKVDAVVGLAPSNHPTTLSGLTELAKRLKLLEPGIAGLNLLGLPALAQQADQSPNPPAPFYRNLNGAAGETVPGVTYTNIVTRNDEVVTPYRQGFITAGPGARVDNVVIQDVCAIDQSEHLSLPYSKNVAQIVLNKLDPTDVRPVRCFAQAPVIGTTQLFG